MERDSRYPNVRCGFCSSDFPQEKIFREALTQLAPSARGAETSVIAIMLNSVCKIWLSA